MAGCNLYNYFILSLSAGWLVIIFPCKMKAKLLKCPCCDGSVVKVIHYGKELYAEIVHFTDKKGNFLYWFLREHICKEEKIIEQLGLK